MSVREVEAQRVRAQGARDGNANRNDSPPRGNDANGGNNNNQNNDIEFNNDALSSPDRWSLSSPSSPDSDARMQFTLEDVTDGLEDLRFEVRAHQERVVDLLQQILQLLRQTN
mmetsp:Transcript_6993/g.16986  ORF Transcript_6993/g.16986 Transcript_6993/m.16986 type:complete len:113 (+) Transcript_6993:71-409(+)|eukprot:CAMPEP_0179002420 /NCGR_PEP_ID=MMETSP0795-20121207/11999_1 /TAXON_ID=88552 /ORGANISM="Amoebophrya sp., Strain Ameob2" /LENGTH=112 /DNA_ID=CAMNT_0020696089 /DNA_START=51 /DNA_END=389 /DNA_ORIENTATION=+